MTDRTASAALPTRKPACKPIRKWRYRARMVRWAAALGLGLLAGVGCERSYYRQRADEAASCMVQLKRDAVEPVFEVPESEFDVYPDPRSRFFSPYNADFPPKPPENAADDALLRCVDGKRGADEWFSSGVAGDIENPCWQLLLPTYTKFNDDGEMVLDLPTAALLARIHSPDYQDATEAIYLSALDVSFERFRFDVQFFGGNVTEFDLAGNGPRTRLGATGPTPGNASSVLSTTSSFRAERRFATAADLLVGFANSFVWQFSGDNTNFATSLINFAFTQPLLRGGGRVIALETLTRAERNLLRNMRSMYQFRQGFFTDVAVGSNPISEPRRIGGFSGGAGLSGFTGTGQGGFGGVGASTNFGTFFGGGGGVGGTGAGGGAGLAGGGERSVGGFYGLAQTAQAIRNTEASLASQQLTLELLEANFAGGLIDLVQVDEFRQNIETERATLLQAKVGYQDSVENYLIDTLGLPPTLPVKIDDSLIDQFQFIDPDVSALQVATTGILQEIGRSGDAEAVAGLDDYAQRLEAIVGKATAQIAQVRDEFRELEAAEEEILGDDPSERRKESLDEALETVGVALADLARRFGEVPEAMERMNAGAGDADGTLKPDQDGKDADGTPDLGIDVDGTDVDAEPLRDGRPKQPVGAEQADTPVDPDRSERLTTLVGLARDTSSLLQELALLQARLRLERVNLDPIELDFERAFLVARDNRADWINNRSGLVDQWRLIAFNANRLKSQLDIELSGGVGTNGDRPLNFDAATGTLNARLVFDAPITRVSERNLYREALISYQRTKRGYIGYVDAVALGLRGRLRQIGRLEENLEIQRRALVIAIRRTDQTLEALNEPVPAAQPGQPAPQLGPTAAQNLLRALSDLRNAQDNFLSVYLAFVSARMNLYIELGIMDIDDRGLFVEETLDQAIARVSGLSVQPPPGCTVEQFLGEMDGFGGPSIEEVADVADLPDEKLVQFVYETAGRQAAETPERLPAAQRETLWQRLTDFVKGKEDVPEPPSKESFARNLRLVMEMRQRGMDVAQITGEAGLDVAAVQAYLQVLPTTDLPVARPIAEPVQVVMETAPAPLPALPAPPTIAAKPKPAPQKPAPPRVAGSAERPPLRLPSLPEPHDLRARAEKAGAKVPDRVIIR